MERLKVQELNRRSVLKAFSFTPILFVLPKGIIAESPRKHPSPFKEAPLMVLPNEVGYKLKLYKQVYGKHYWVVTDATSVAGYRTNRVVFFGFASLPRDRQEKVYGHFRCRCKPGGTVEYW